MFKSISKYQVSISVEYVYVLLLEKLRVGRPVSRIEQEVSVTDPSNGGLL